MTTTDQGAFERSREQGAAKEFSINEDGTIDLRPNAVNDNDTEFGELSEGVAQDYNSVAGVQDISDAPSANAQSMPSDGKAKRGRKPAQ